MWDLKVVMLKMIFFLLCFFDIFVSFFSFFGIVLRDEVIIIMFDFR